MQTFLPYPDFNQTAKCLDRQRLGKQRIESWQILQAIQDENYGWQNHPCTNMWRNYPRLLCLYGLAICDEWISRGYKDTMKDRFFSQLIKYDNVWLDGKYQEDMPKWLGNDKFHSSHRAALLYKNYEHYSQFGWNEEPKLDYIWIIE
jgi:hypothetical protein